MSAVVTGAGNGIGQASALALAASGMAVACLDVDLVSASHTAELVTEAGGRATAIQCDVTDESECNRAVAEAVSAIGPVESLVTCAGIERTGAAENLPAELYRGVVDVNLFGSLAIAQSVARGMIAHGTPGSIVLVASANAFASAPGQAAYTASKGAVVSLARGLAVDWAQYGIRVNSVAPGVTATAMSHASLTDPTRSRRLLSRIPLGRAAHPDEIAAVIAFLCSPAASYVTAAVIPVDGGWLARS